MVNKNDKKSMWEHIKENPLLSLIVVANLVLVCFNYQSNERMGKLFVGQNKPLIDVTPISIKPLVSKVGKDKPDMAKTMFSVVNYSGFDAYDIVIDVKYGEVNSWISEWSKANDDNKKEIKGVVIGKTFLSAPKAPTPKSFIPKLESDDVGYSRNTGSLDLQGKVCSEGAKGYPVLVRVTWRNKLGHVFDEIHEYRLICTKVYSGRSFTFIPKGIISQKD